LSGTGDDGSGRYQQDDPAPYERLQLGQTVVVTCSRGYGCAVRTMTVQAGYPQDDQSRRYLYERLQLGQTVAVLQYGRCGAGRDDAFGRVASVPYERLQYNCTVSSGESRQYSTYSYSKKLIRGPATITNCIFTKKKSPEPQKKRLVIRRNTKISN
jgi:hypothetical protein